MKRKFKVTLDLQWDIVISIEAEPDDSQAEYDAIEQAIEYFGEEFSEGDFSDAFEAVEIKRKKHRKKR